MGCSFSSFAAYRPCSCSHCSGTSGGNNENTGNNSSSNGNTGASDKNNKTSAAETPDTNNPSNSDSSEAETPATDSSAEAPVSLKTPALKVSTAWNKVTLRWNSVSNADSYILYKKTNNGKYVKLKTLSKDKKVYTDTKVSVGSTYRYVLKAGTTTASGKKIYSSLSKAVTAKPALSRPTLTLRTLSGKQRISWRKVSGATGYILYQRTGNGLFRKIKVLTFRSTSWSVRTKKGTLYSYKLVPYRKVNGKIKTGTATLTKKARAR